MNLNYVCIKTKWTLYFISYFYLNIIHIWNNTFNIYSLSSIWLFILKFILLQNKHIQFKSHSALDYKSSFIFNHIPVKLNVTNHFWKLGNKLLLLFSVIVYLILTIFLHHLGFKSDLLSSHFVSNFIIYNFKLSIGLSSKLYVLLQS